MDYKMMLYLYVLFVILMGLWNGYMTEDALGNLSCWELLAGFISTVLGRIFFHLYLIDAFMGRLLEVKVIWGCILQAFCHVLVYCYQ